MTQDYLRWVADSTKTTWWHDSAEPNELAVGLERGAVGVTTNPFLAALALSRHREQWSDEIRAVFAEGLEPEERAGALMGIAVRHAAQQVHGEFENSKKEMGYVCAQVNPARAANREAMLRMARRFRSGAPNIAVELPATCAGLGGLGRAAVPSQVLRPQVDKVKPEMLIGVGGSVGRELSAHAAAHPDIIITSARKGDGIETLRGALATLARPAQLG